MQLSSIIRLWAVVACLAPTLSFAQYCDIESPQLVWGVPEKNATDVPTNTQIVLINSYGSELEVTLNDEPLIAAGTSGMNRFLYPLAAQLLPNTEYRIVGTFVGDATTAKFSRKFTTGSGPSTTSLPAVQVAGQEAAKLDISEMCGQLVAAQQCPNQSSDFVTITASPSVQVLVIKPENGTTEDGYLWPKECATFAFPAEVQNMTTPCYEVSTLDAMESNLSTSSYCPDTSTGGSGGGGRRAASCNQSSQPTPGGGLGWLSIVFWGTLIVIRKSRCFVGKSNAPGA